MSAVIHPFVEEVCHEGDRLRPVGPEAVFTIESVGMITSRHGAKFRLNATVRGHQRIWYDPDDEMILAMLYEQIPEVKWQHFVFWRSSDHSCVEILDPKDDSIAARLFVRRGSRVPDPSGESVDWTNVVCPWRRKT